MTKIGYQGVEHSHNHAAVETIISETELRESDIHLVPLISSINVVNALVNGEIEYGVMAIENSIGGKVKESSEALKDRNFKIFKEITLPISHATFKLDESIPNGDIVEVISHPQALKQCQGNLKRIFPNAKLSPVANTALAPKYVAEGKYNQFTAAVCAKVAGLHYDLCLVEAHIQDKSDNRTTFRMLSNT